MNELKMNPFFVIAPVLKLWYPFDLVLLSGKKSTLASGDLEAGLDPTALRYVKISHQKCGMVMWTQNNDQIVQI